MMQLLLHVLVSRLVSDGESQAESCVLIDGATPVLTAHATDGGKACGGDVVSLHTTAILNQWAAETMVLPNVFLSQLCNHLL